MSRFLTQFERANYEIHNAVHKLLKSLAQEERTGNKHRHARHFTGISRQRHDNAFAMHCSHFFRLADGDHSICAIRGNQSIALIREPGKPRSTVMHAASANAVCGRWQLQLLAQAGKCTWGNTKQHRTRTTYRLLRR
jgi:hypothetical protein